MTVGLTVHGDAEARRNALVLTAAAALSGSAPSIAISLGGLAGTYLLGPDKTLATLPVSFFVVGSALGAIPAARLMARAGRRSGFIAGAMVGIVGSLIAAYAVLHGSFLVFTVGLAIAGLAGAFTQQYRFAAADNGSPEFRAKAISLVMLGGIAAAVLGPQSMILTRNWFNPIPFVGSYIAMAVLFFGGMLVLLLLNGAARAAPPRSAETGSGRPLSEIVRQPRFIVALICGICSYGLMSLVMTAAPLAMVACGFGQDTVALGIQWHILAMYGPSFFTGNLIARFGEETVVAVGLALLAACAVLALAGIEIMHFWGALILLGLGWNFGFIGATTMLTGTYRPEERSRVQGLNDTILFGCVAIASFSSGSLFSSAGWEAINLVVFPVVAVCLAALIFAALRRKRAPAG